MELHAVEARSSDAPHGMLTHCLAGTVLQINLVYYAPYIVAIAVWELTEENWALRSEASRGRG